MEISYRPTAQLNKFFNINLQVGEGKHIFTPAEEKRCNLLLKPNVFQQ